MAVAEDQDQRRGDRPLQRDDGAVGADVQPVAVDGDQVGGEDHAGRPVVHVVGRADQDVAGAGADQGDAAVHAEQHVAGQRGQRDVADAEDLRVLGQRDDPVRLAEHVLARRDVRVQRHDEIAAGGREAHVAGDGRDARRQADEDPVAGDESDVALGDDDRVVLGDDVAAGGGDHVAAGRDVDVDGDRDVAGGLEDDVAAGDDDGRVDHEDPARRGQRDVDERLELGVGVQDDVAGRAGRRAERLADDRSCGRRDHRELAEDGAAGAVGAGEHRDVPGRRDRGVGLEDDVPARGDGDVAVGRHDRAAGDHADVVGVALDRAGGHDHVEQRGDVLGDRDLAVVVGARSVDGDERHGAAGEDAVRVAHGGLGDAAHRHRAGVEDVDAAGGRAALERARDGVGLAGLGRQELRRRADVPGGEQLGLSGGDVRAGARQPVEDAAVQRRDERDPVRARGSHRRDVQVARGLHDVGVRQAAEGRQRAGIGQVGVAAVVRLDQQLVAGVADRAVLGEERDAVGDHVEVVGARREDVGRIDVADVVDRCGLERDVAEVGADLADGHLAEVRAQVDLVDPDALRGVGGERPGQHLEGVGGLADRAGAGAQLDGRGEDLGEGRPEGVDDRPVRLEPHDALLGVDRLDPKVLGVAGGVAVLDVDLELRAGGERAALRVVECVVDEVREDRGRGGADVTLAGLEDRQACAQVDPRRGAGAGVARHGGPGGVVDVGGGLEPNLARGLDGAEVEVDARADQDVGVGVHVEHAGRRDVHGLDLGDDDVRHDGLQAARDRHVRAELVEQDVVGGQAERVAVDRDDPEGHEALRVVQLRAAELDHVAREEKPGEVAPGPGDGVADPAAGAEALVLEVDGRGDRRRAGDRLERRVHDDRPDRDVARRTRRREDLAELQRDRVAGDRGDLEVRQAGRGSGARRVGGVAGDGDRRPVGDRAPRARRARDRGAGRRGPGRERDGPRDRRVEDRDDLHRRRELRHERRRAVDRGDRAGDRGDPVVGEAVGLARGRAQHADRDAAGQRDERAGDAEVGPGAARERDRVAQSDEVHGAVVGGAAQELDVGALGAREQDVLRRREVVPVELDDLLAVVAPDRAGAGRDAVGDDRDVVGVDDRVAEDGHGARDRLEQAGAEEVLQLVRSPDLDAGGDRVGLFGGEDVVELGLVGEGDGGRVPARAVGQQDGVRVEDLVDRDALVDRGGRAADEDRAPGVLADERGRQRVEHHASGRDDAVAVRGRVVRVGQAGPVGQDVREAHGVQVHEAGDRGRDAGDRDLLPDVLCVEDHRVGGELRGLADRPVGLARVVGEVDAGVGGRVDRQHHVVGVGHRGDRGLQAADRDRLAHVRRCERGGRGLQRGEARADDAVAEAARVAVGDAAQVVEGPAAAVLQREAKLDVVGVDELHDRREHRDRVGSAGDGDRLADVPGGEGGRRRVQVRAAADGAVGVGDLRGLDGAEGDAARVEHGRDGVRDSVDRDRLADVGAREGRAARVERGDRSARADDCVAGPEGVRERLGHVRRARAVGEGDERPGGSHVGQAHGGRRGDRRDRVLDAADDDLLAEVAGHEGRARRGQRCRPLGQDAVGEGRGPGRDQRERDAARAARGDGQPHGGGVDEPGDRVRHAVDPDRLADVGQRERPRSPTSAWCARSRRSRRTPCGRPGRRWSAARGGCR